MPIVKLSADPSTWVEVSDSEFAVLLAQGALWTGSTVAEETINIKTTMNPSVWITVTLTEYYDLLRQGLVAETEGGGPIPRPNFTDAQYDEAGDPAGVLGQRLAESLGAPSGTTFPDALSAAIETIVDASGYGISDDVLPIAGEVTALGESTTANAGYETHLAEYTGLTIFNLGVSGNGLADELLRIGAIRPKITLQDGTIPTGSFNIPITAINPDRGWRRNGTGAFDVGVIVKGLTVNLRNDLVTNTFRLVGTNPGAPITIEPGTEAVRIPSALNPKRRILFDTLRNNVTADMVALVEMLPLIFDAQSTRVKEVLIVGPINGAGEGIGTTNYNRITAAIDRAKELLGARFYDIRRDFIDRGLTIRGIEPTVTDEANIAADRPPASLWEAPNTGVHPNEEGYLVKNYLLAEKLLEIGWVTTVNLPEIPVNLQWETWTSDSFNRADGAFGTTDAANGGTPRTPLAIDSQVGIAGNRYGATTTLTANRAVYFDTSSREQAIEFDNVGGTSVLVQIGRADANNNYVFEGYTTSGTGIYRRSGGSKVAVASSSQQLVAGSRIRFECYFVDEAQTELRLRAFQNGVKIAEFTDTSPLAGGTKNALLSPSSGTAYALDNLLIQTRVA